MMANANELHKKLIAVSGNSPQIITETLFALGAYPEKHAHFWPDELEIITTSFGEKAIKEGLQNKGQLDAVCQRVGKPPITKISILCIKDKHGRPVNDARDEDDHDAMANFITQRVQSATENSNTRLHASIAGGRKTMTFYLGYAMSLFARHYDRMSHVLVSEGYEGRRDFYFPTEQPQPLEPRGDDETPLDASHAEVTLTDIPFIRLRNLLPSGTLHQRGTSDTIDFRRVVDMINLGDTPDDIAIDVDHAALALHVSNRWQRNVLATVVFSNPLHWEFYNLLLEDTLSDPEGRHLWERDSQGELATLLRDLIYSRLFDRHPEILDRQGNLDRDALAEKFPNAERTYKSLQEGVTGARFSSLCNEIKQLFQQYLPKNLSEHLTPLQLFNSEDGKYYGAVFQGGAKPKKAPSGYSYGIPLRRPAAEKVRYR